MKEYKIAIIGAGNISNTRHIPALKKVKNAKLFGVIGIKESNVLRTAKRNKVSNTLVLNNNVSYYDSFNNCEWFKEVDAVIIGVPPKEHYPLVEAALNTGKHVLVEKPMCMDTIEAKKLIDLSKKVKKRISVMHNFQYANGVLRLERLLKDNELGKITSFFEVQFTNRYRRLPEWYNELPLGLFYDEAAHFMYLLRKFGGKIKIDNAHAYFNDSKDSTPILLNASLKAGKYPVNLVINFNSPICEWNFMVCGENKIAIYDFFKDILIVLPTDGEHRAQDILRNSWKYTAQYWFQFIKNGFKMVTGSLLYGHDVVISKFLNSIENNGDIHTDVNAGYDNVESMNEIVNKINKK